ncbi:XF1762 family protein [Streptomyces sp. NPDC050211]|uniref:XF1762 family protein n=1 Tax=Streptomyces sp. NPDC050211 TaxID=3154932 RepID=UPI00342B9DC4
MNSDTFPQERVAARTGRQTRRALAPTRTRPSQPVLNVVPVTFRQARSFIAAHHRHHRPPQGMKFTLGVATKETLVGVAVVGRPIARHLDDGRTAEVTRTCTDGTPNANSALYAAAWRAARALGYQRLITYSERGESGASLRAAGFQPTARLAPHHGWDRPSRRRRPSNQGIARTRWEVARAPDPSGPTGRANNLFPDDQLHTGT